MDKQAIDQIIGSVLPMSKQEGDAEKKKTVVGTFHVGALSGNRLNSGTLRSQFIVCESESVWNNSSAREALHSDQRVFVQTGNDIWDVYSGTNSNSESNMPIIVAQNQPGLQNLLIAAKTKLLPLMPATANASNNGFFFRPDILAAIRTKPFILLAGISGTGKTRLVRQLALGCCNKSSPLAGEKSSGNYECIPVRPNWHDSTELLGYVTRITKNNESPKYVVTPFVEFLAKAWTYHETPFFLCLDEMNLAPVEQYFAEYLSVVESRDRLKVGDGENGFECITSRERIVRFDTLEKETRDGLLRDLFDEKDWAKKAEHGRVEQIRKLFEKDEGMRLPPNLVVMGTVNMDETTCTFSRKVLDRSMSFELNDVSDMYDEGKLADEKDADLESIAVEQAQCSLLTGKEAYDSSECQVAVKPDGTKAGKAILDFLRFFNEEMAPAKTATGEDAEGKDPMPLLSGTSFKIAYRTRNEILIYCAERTKHSSAKLPQALDEAVSMKILSRIEGDRRRVTAEWLQTLKAAIASKLSELDGYDAKTCTICSAKLDEMVQQVGSGYVSFWMG